MQGGPILPLAETQVVHVEQCFRHVEELRDQLLDAAGVATPFA